MFGSAVAFLLALATLVVIFVDMPSLSERALDEQLANAATEGELAAGVTPAVEGTPAADDSAQPPVELILSVEPPVATLAQFAGWFMLAIWPLFIAEAVLYWLVRPRGLGQRRQHLHAMSCCLFPPLRMCLRSPEMGEAIWFPWVGWQQPNDQLRESLVRFFSIPMLGIAVLILPVLGIEFFLKEQVDRYPALRYGLHFSTGLIWFAFTTEFIVMISAADKKLAYCKKHWLDLAIILLPIISFLRSLQVLRATRLAKVAKVQQLTKMARVYRLRGVSTKALRALVLFDLAQRLFRIRPEKRLASLRNQRQQLLKDLAALDGQIDKLEVLCKARAEAAADKAKTEPAGTPETGSPATTAQEIRPVAKPQAKPVDS